MCLVHPANGGRVTGSNPVQPTQRMCLARPAIGRMVGSSDRPSHWVTLNLLFYPIKNWCLTPNQLFKIKE